MLEINHNVSNQKVKDLLGWEPLSNNEETILESLDTLEKYHLIGWLVEIVTMILYFKKDCA